jgi:hypothetical protein
VDVLWQRLQAESPEAVARRAAVEFEAAGPVYAVPLCGQPVRVLPMAKRVECSGGPAGFEPTLVCVQYLLTAQDEPPAGERVGPRSLPSGDFFFRGPHDFPTERLVTAFGDRPEAFCRASEKIGGQPVAAGDAAYEFAALPRVPMTIILWQTDEEFPARVQMLVDRGAHRQLPLDALLVLANVLAKRLIAAAEE